METPCTPARRQLYLACFIPSRLFPAHWAMWVPSADDEHIGTLVQVIGDPLNGFVHEFERGYKSREDSRPPLLQELGSATEDSVLPDGPHDPGQGCGRGQTKPRIAIDNCQSWLSRLIDAMVAQHMIDDGARGVLKTAPKN
ncbi:hypothetical protein B0T22DRAFT_437276 [Podospora appendiculata]|uniref:Uncharacterized protein n=1 Tax=Podospora appendiculata TaxID=314037 RepID=A0AAE0XIR9_9PEZI|nr:hypothetical protein B0T22DRAFT_437276 [Podospora appendiculata]